MSQQLQRGIRESRYDDWELYFLIFAVLLGAAIILQIRAVTDFLYQLDYLPMAYGYDFSQTLIAAFQGIVIGMSGGWIYSQGDRYFAFLTDSYDTKETALIVRIGLMTLLGIGVGLVLPDLVRRYFEFVVVQTTGIVVITGYRLIHTEIIHWRIENELPVLVAGFILVVAPFLQ
jgi:hypothetical protein